MRNGKLLCAALAALMLWSAGGFAAEPDGEPAYPAIGEKGLTLGESSIAYPALEEGAAEEELRERINERILEDGGIRDYVTRISQLISGGKLEVSWQGTTMGPVFSFAVSAEGAVSTPRRTHVWTGGNIDLRDGHEVTEEEIFRDPAEARGAMETWLEEELAPELSAHLASSALAPAPELFRMTERGIILMYPAEQLSTLSDRAGDVLVPWNVLADQLNLDEGGILSAMGVPALISPGEAGAEALRAAAAGGSLPGIPAKLGDGMQELTDRWHLLTDPDVYAMGRLFAPEGAPFQGVQLTTDYLTESWENSRVDGIRVNLGGVCGLNIGSTRAGEWRELLGEPDYSITLDEEQAEAWRTAPGVRDYYETGGHRLQLQADGEGILAGIQLSE